MRIAVAALETLIPELGRLSPSSQLLSERDRSFAQGDIVTRDRIRQQITALLQRAEQYNETSQSLATRLQRATNQMALQILDSTYRDRADLVVIRGAVLS